MNQSKTVPRVASELIRPLTSIRAFAAGWVVLHHLHREFFDLCPPLNHLGWLAENGRLGVDLFFVLSGFILCHVYYGHGKMLTPKTYAQFICLRFARIYPAYLVAILVMAAFVFAARFGREPYSAGRYPFSILPWELLMVHAWRLTMDLAQQGWNAVDWSVSAEWFAYLFMFPAAGAILFRLKKQWQFLCLAAAFLTCLAFFRFFDHTGLDITPLPRVIVEFLAGAMIYGIRRQGIIPGPNVCDGLLIIGMLALAISLHSPDISGIRYTITVAILSIFIFLLSYENGFISRALAIKPLVYLGEVSYSLYLTHMIVQRVLKVILHPDTFVTLDASRRMMFLLIYASALLGAAILMYHAVEHPARGYLRAKFRSGKKLIVTDQVMAPTGTGES